MSKCMEYPVDSPFRPDKKYPEYPFDELSTKENRVYDAVREAFYLMEFDKINYGTEKWNPLGGIIKPGQTVVIKPNMVKDYNTIGDGTDCLFTNPSVIAAIVDYVIIALGREGKIIIGDAPMQECNFDNLVKISGYDRLIEYYQKKLDEKVQIEVQDFRELKTIVNNGVYVSKTTASNGVVVDLKTESEFYGKTKEYFDNLRITNYDPQYLKSHHSIKKHEYYINKNVLLADVIINCPKPKTHSKAGITCSLKNMIGANSRKEYLPHHAMGAAKDGGDEYSEKSTIKRIKSFLADKRNYYFQTKKAYGLGLFYRQLERVCTALLLLSKKDKFLEGNWSGNNTISKTIIDVNRAILYSDKQGKLQNSKQRVMLTIADMIISGEGEGPLFPNAKKTGMIIIGENSVCVDEVVAKIMGAKENKIPTLISARQSKSKLKLVDECQIPMIISNTSQYNGHTIEELTNEAILYYKPSSGWKDAFYERNR